jgi:hypothetical protein
MMNSMRAAVVRAMAAITLGLAISACSHGGSLPPAAQSERTDSGLKGTYGTGAPLTVMTNVSVITLTPGSTTSVPCALTVQSSDTSDPRYSVTAWGTGTVLNGKGGYPLEDAPRRDNVAWGLDGQNPTTPLGNSGSPGQQITAAAPSAPATHCINLAVTAPAGTAAGSYPLGISFNLSGGSGSLLLTRASATANLTVTVL